MIHTSIRSRLLSVLICGLGCSAVAFAGNDTGNGGNSVVCFGANGDIRSAELLDLYEARVMRGILPDLGAPGLPYPQKVEIALSRLERLSPVRAAKYRTWISEFERDSLFLAGVTLVEVPDSDHIAIPAGCKRIQLIVQRKPAFPEDKRYTVSRDIWDHLDNDSRAATLLHEVIYREGFEENYHTNSTASRYFNSIVVSDRLSSMTLEAFANVLVSLPMTDLGIRSYGMGGVLKPIVGQFHGVTDSEGNLLHPTFKPLPITYYPGGDAVRTAWLSGPEGDFHLSNGPNGIWYALDFAGRGRSIRAGFSSDGALLELYTSNDDFYAIGGASSIRQTWLGTLIVFDAQGSLASVQAYIRNRMDRGGMVKMHDGREASLRCTSESGPCGTLYFNPDGSYARSSGEVVWRFD